jgi:ABC-type phosphate transport system substrate-binding protein
VRPKLQNVLAAFFASLLMVPAAVRGQERTVLVETGSSMPEPLYKNWIDAYHKQQPSIDIRYMAPGTAERERNILAGSGDFGGGDAPIRIASSALRKI